MDCFGVYSLFSIDSKHCHACPKLKDCMTACYNELTNLSKLGSVKPLLKKHIALMKKFEVEGAKDIKSERQTTSKEVAQLSNELEKGGLIKMGRVAEDLSSAPQYFSLGVGYLRSLKETTDEKFVRHIKDRLTDTIGVNKDSAAMGLAAIVVQTLNKYKIIKVVGHKISWIATSAESV